MNHPFMYFSVIIPLFNKADHIVDTLKSVLEQTHREFEVLVIDDGSTDNGYQLVKQVQNERVRVFEKPNGGASSARNHGMQLARGDYFAFLDADDFWLEDHLETLARLIRQFGSVAKVFATSIEKSGDKTVSLEPHRSVRAPELISDYFARNSKTTSLVSSSSFAIEKHVYLQGFTYDTRISYGEDVEYWCRIFKHFQLAKSHKVTSIYNQNASNRSNSQTVPLSRRFHQFDFQNASPSERQYYGKLIALLLLDYSMRPSPANVVKTILFHWRHLHLTPRYFALLLLKRISQT